MSVLNHTYAKQTIKGYATSQIAKREKNDCVVRAMAASLDVGYDVAHKLVKEEMARVDGRGTPTQAILSAMAKFKHNGLKVNGRTYEVNILPKIEIINQYKVKGEIIDRKKTVKSFIQTHQWGTYMVLVANHAFTIKDGILIDNVGEEFRPTRKVEGAFLIEEKNKGGQLNFFSDEEMKQMKRGGLAYLS